MEACRRPSFCGTVSLRRLGYRAVDDAPWVETAATLSLSPAADGTTVADAIRLIRVDVERGFSYAYDRNGAQTSVTNNDPGARVSSYATSYDNLGPVCDYPGLTTAPYETWTPPEAVLLEPPYSRQLGSPSYEVCPRCGYEFGNDDDPGTAAPVSFERYRLEWEGEGAPWFDERTRPE